MAGTKVKERMRREVIAVHPDDDLSSKALIRKLRRFHTLPVLDRNEQLVGLLTEQALLGSGARATEREVGELTVGELMSHEPATIGDDATVADAAGMLLELGFRHLPVVDPDGHLVGIVSERDLRMQLGTDLRGWYEAPSAMLDQPLAEVMTREPITLSPEAKVESALESFSDDRVGALPVVDEAGTPVGILSYVDVLAWLREQETSERAGANEAELPEKMRAAAIDRYGGPEELHVETLPVPHPKGAEVLIRLRAAGVGVWDSAVRSGAFQLGKQSFPMVIGNDGAGEVVAVGEKAKRFRVGEKVYAFGREGGFYAQYVAVDESEVARIPEGMSLEEAATLGADGITALLGLEDELELNEGDAVMIFGASGGVGHLAIQLAEHMGAQVFAVASGADGVALARKLGAEGAVDGKKEDVLEAARGFRPQGFDAALVLANSPALEPALAAIKEGGRMAHPHGVMPPPKAPKGVSSRAYDGTPSAEGFERLNRWIEQGPFHVEVEHLFSLEDAAQAHLAVSRHHLGKLALRVGA